MSLNKSNWNIPQNGQVESPLKGYLPQQVQVKCSSKSARGNMTVLNISPKLCVSKGYVSQTILLDMTAIDHGMLWSQ